jgi:predicted nucleic acid-binding protein
VLYLDSSALIKKYFVEPGTPRLQAKLKQETEAGAILFSSGLTYAEMHASVARRQREDALSEMEADDIHDQFDRDWATAITRVELSSAVLAFVRDVVKASPLRGADTLHLASALWLRDSTRLGVKSGDNSGWFTFVSSDRQLLAAAKKQKILTFNPSEPST